MSTTTALKKMIKHMPKGSMFTLSELEKPEIVSTGVSTVDFALGTGGYARGCQYMLYGGSSSGKTALCLTTIGNYQKDHPDSYSCIIDMEHSMTQDWAVKFGIDLERLIVMRPATSDEMYSMTMEAIESGIFDFIVVDSLGAGMLKSELDNENARMAGSSGVITRLVKAINSSFITIERAKKEMQEEGEDTSNLHIPVVLLINQIRANMSMYGPSEIFSGGKALEHMMTAIVHVRASKAAGEKIEAVVDGEKVQVGSTIYATIQKNKLGMPNKTASYIFSFKETKDNEFGIDNARSLADLSLLIGIATVTGNTITFPVSDDQTDKVVGRKKFLERIKQDKELQKYLAVRISASGEVHDEDVEILEEFND